MDYYSTFKSKYTDKKDKALDEYINREPFEFNADTSKLYNTYKKHYDAAGKQAMKDTLGQATALSGGYNNSYAQQAAQQTYNSYMSELESMLPEFEEQAYNRYENEGNKLLDYYEILNNAEADEYNKFVDDRNYNYQLSRDAVADDQWNKQYYASLYGGDSSGDESGSAFNRMVYSSNYTDEDTGKRMYEYYQDGKKYEFEQGYNPYTGTINNDAKTNGKYDESKTFDNKYQPNNIGGQALKAARDEYGVPYKGTVNGVTQYVWTTGDGRYWMWDGTQNRYVQYEDPNKQ